MNIVWSSAADFFAMGGYGFYVWGSFGMTALAIAAEIWALRRTRQDLQAACRTWGVESENQPQRGQFLPGLQAHSSAMGQKDGEKWGAAADVQPTTPKSDRLPGPQDNNDDHTPPDTKD